VTPCRVSSLPAGAIEAPGPARFQQIALRGAFLGLVSAEIRPEAGLELVSEILLGLNLARMLLGEVPDRDHVRRVLDGVGYSLVTGRTGPGS
jgi:hypothetical protein